MSAPVVRCHGFDWLRAAGIAGVVWIHGCDTNGLLLRWSHVASAAVPVFVLVSAFLLQRAALRDPSLSIRNLVLARLARLLPAYLCWTLVYLAVRWFKHHATGHAGQAPQLVPAVLLGGASYQLYFVAALVWWTPLFAPLALLGARASACGRRRFAVLLGIAGALLLAAAFRLSGRLHFAPEHFLFQQMIAFTGYMPLGLAAGLVWRPEARASRSPAACVVPPLCLLGGAAWLLLRLSWFTPAGPALLLFAWALLHDTRPAPAPVLRVSAWSYGIFLAHGLFVEGLQTAFGLADASLSTVPATLFVISASFLLSCLVCLVLGHFRRTRFLVS